MNKLYKMIVILAMMFTFTDIYAQGAYVTWPLSSTTTISPSTPVGNIQATTQTIGTSNPQMTVSLPYTTEGQRLYFQIMVGRQVRLITVDIFNTRSPQSQATIFMFSMCPSIMVTILTLPEISTL